MERHAFQDVLKDVTSLGHKVDQSQFREFGGIPIIDQGKEFIAARSNATELSWQHQLPVILFGDHTRIFKFVDFPFILGADGVKVLKAKAQNIPLYLYYHLLDFDIPSEGYSRHFKFLQEMFFCIPSLTEQRRIAAILARADRLRRLRRTALQLSESYLQSVFVQMFGDLATNPMGWDIETLADIDTKFTYGTSEKCFPNKKGLPVLRIPNVLNAALDLTDLKYANLSDNEARKLQLQVGDLLFVRTNGNPNYVGRCAVFNINEPYLYASYLIKGALNKSRLDPIFTSTLLRSSAGREAMLPYIRTTAGQSNIGIEGLGQVPMIIPPLSLQQRFAAVAARYERLCGQQREALRQAEHLFQTLLHRAFRGELGQGDV